ncbi:MAG: GDSL-type esterase/lipase family protein [Oscillospiraceae bacterium]|nr:GDSL-type esterase/lipase family protein [Oscillospiraceae bacterium]
MDNYDNRNAYEIYKNKQKRRKAKRKRLLFRTAVVLVIIALIVAALFSMVNCVNNLICVNCNSIQNTTESTAETSPTEKPKPQKPAKVKDPVEPSFFDKTVIVGDSITLGLSYYLEKQNGQGNKPLGDAFVLCNGSLGYINAKENPVGDSNCRLPVYKGKQQPIEDSVADIGAERVYILLGMNDVARADSKTLITYVKDLTDKIKKKSPKIRICLESTTPIIASKQGPYLNDKNIRKFDKELKKFAKENDYSYIDLYSVVSDDKGHLKDEYCGDPQNMGLHFNDTAQAAVIDYLINHPDGI